MAEDSLAPGPAVVLVGITGAGKSTIGNLLVSGDPSEGPFEVSDSMQSCTKFPQVHESPDNRVGCKVVDTPGAFDSSGGVERARLLNDVTRIIKELDCVVLLVVSADRGTADYLALLVDLLGMVVPVSSVLVLVNKLGMSVRSHTQAQKAVEDVLAHLNCSLEKRGTEGRLSRARYFKNEGVALRQEGEREYLSTLPGAEQLLEKLKLQLQLCRPLCPKAGYGRTVADIVGPLRTTSMECSALVESFSRDAQELRRQAEVAQTTAERLRNEANGMSTIVGFWALPSVSFSLCNNATRIEMLLKEANLREQSARFFQTEAEKKARSAADKQAALETARGELA